MNANKTVTANFTQIPPAQYTLAVNVNGSGSVTKNPNKTSYSTGEQVTISTAGSGYSFSGWSGGARRNHKPADPHHERQQNGHGQFYTDTPSPVYVGGKCQWFRVGYKESKQDELQYRGAGDLNCDCGCRVQL